MSSIRRRLDEGWIMEEDIEFFKQNKGAVPLCCCCAHFSDPITYKRYPEPLYECDQMTKPLPLSEFRPFCLKCQEYIESKLKEMGK